MSGIDDDDLDVLLGPPATPVQRRRQQASHARFDHAVGLVEQAAKAASSGDQQALQAAVARMEQVAFDDFEQCHAPSAALDYLLYDVVCELVPDDDDARFGDTWIDHLVHHADHDLAPAAARWGTAGGRPDQRRVPTQQRRAGGHRAGPRQRPG